MRFLYTLLFICVLPAVLLRLVIRGYRERGYWLHWSERFGFVNFFQNNVQKTLWVHAVSVGEVKASHRFLLRLQEQYPKYRLLLTVTTPTGRQIASQLGINKLYVAFLPYDLPIFLNRLIKHIHPKALFIVESELWPNLILGCAKKDIPVFLVNGRMSERSFSKRRYIRAFMQDIFSVMTGILTQSQSDAERFEALGAPVAKISVLGNFKYEIKTEEDKAQSLSKDLDGFFAHYDWTWIAASVHKEEIATILQTARTVISRAEDQRKSVLLILAPRYPKQLDMIMNMIKNMQLTSVCMSSEAAPTYFPHVFVIDTLGNLPSFYQFSKVAFIGGSFSPIGGHNLLEAAVQGLPTLIGPHHFNQKAIVTELTAIDNCDVVAHGSALTEKLLILLNNASMCEQRGQAGKIFVLSNQGIVDKVIAWCFERISEQ